MFRNRFTQVLIVCAVFSTVLFSIATAAEAQVDDNSILFGAHPSQRFGQSRTEALDNLQQTLGKDLAVVRRYLRWEEDASNDPLVQQTLAQDSIAHISVIPRRDNGDEVTWAAIANALPGSDIDIEIRDWAGQISGLEKPVWFTFNHEPETTHNLGQGVDSDFISAWRNVVEIFDEEGVTNAEFVWVMTSYAFSRSELDRRFPQNWYPGDDWVDHIAADPYNWTSCRPGINNPWRSFEESMTPVRDFALNHPDKGLIAAEFGSAEDFNDVDRKAEWVTQIRHLVRDPQWSQMHAVIAYNADHPEPGTECEWWVDSSPETLEAYRAMINDPVFGGNGLPPEPIDDQPICQAALVEGSVSLTWENTVGSEVVRRNNRYLATPADNVITYLDSNPVNGVNDYAIRVWKGGSYIDVACGTLNINPGPAFSCHVLVSANQVTVNWDSTDDREVVRSNNSWLSTPSSEATTFSSPTQPGSYVYQLRTWQDGSYIDTDCGTAVVDEVVVVGSCSVSLADADAVISWQGFDTGSVVVRRNDSWLSSPSGESDADLDVGLLPGTYDYVLRHWLGDNFTDTACGDISVN